jgi:hypothetical protein
MTLHSKNTGKNATRNMERATGRKTLGSIKSLKTKIGNVLSVVNLYSMERN